VTSPLAAALSAAEGAGARSRHVDDWPRLVTEARRADLEPVVAFAVSRGALSVPPAPIATALARAFTEATARHLALARGLGDALAALAGAGVPALPLKGPVLAETLYPHPALRGSTDVDVLVPRDRRADADLALARRGYRATAVDGHDRAFDLAHDAALAYDGPGGIRVDLHWQLVTEPAFRWNERASRAVWTRARHVRIGALDTLALAPEDLLLYLAAHLAAHHGFGGVRWRWDIARVAAGAAGPVEWAVVVARAAEWQVRRALAAALGEVIGGFGVVVPADVVRALRPSGPRASALNALLARADDARRAELEHLIALLATDRTPRAAAAMTRAVCPSRAWLAARYPGVSRAARYRAHGGRLAAVALGTARALLGRGAAAVP
jgi:hypothetical protein